MPPGVVDIDPDSPSGSSKPLHGWGEAMVGAAMPHQHMGKMASCPARCSTGMLGLSARSPPSPQQNAAPPRKVKTPRGGKRRRAGEKLPPIRHHHGPADAPPGSLVFSTPIGASFSAAHHASPGIRKEAFAKMGFKGDDLPEDYDFVTL